MDYQEQYGDLYNLEATPAESTSFRLAKHDRERFPDIITAGKEGETPYYTNSSHLPVGYTADVFDALDVQDELQTLYTSGTVFHTFLGEKLPTWKSAAKLVRTIAENYRLPYYTMSPTYSVCKEHGYIAGEVSVCPHCGKPTEVYSRITGYYRPISNWNEGKLQEYKDRKLYDVRGAKKKKAEDVQPGLKDAVLTMRISLPEGVPSKEPAENTRKMYLFTTKTCPNCKSAKEMMKGLDFITVDAMEQPELTEKYGIMQAPSLVVINGSDVEKYVNASNIKRFVDAQKSSVV